MNSLDTYYRAFKEYRRNTKENKDCQRDREKIRKSNVGEDFLEAIKFQCVIDEDWVKAIEDGLIHVQKALAEERQFIRTNGEVVPIEKAKKVSKHTVEHLARHSNLITHIPKKKSDTLIPDALYIVERLSDYAVYENRFLYMMLCYLRDFLQLRIDKIREARMKYTADFRLVKNIEGKKKKLNFELRFNEDRMDNPYPLFDEKSSGLIRRIEDLQQIVISFLANPIMNEVSKTPVVKPPIVKTNVLKMNNNFKGALALYDYVAGYTGLGVEFVEIKKDFAPFSDEIADEVSEIAMLVSNLSYRYGNELTEILEASFQREEDRRAQEAQKKLDEQIQRLKKRIEEENCSPYEYMVLLEKKNASLIKDSEDLIDARNTIIELNERIYALASEKEELNKKVIELEEAVEARIEEIRGLNAKYLEDMDALKRQQEVQILNIETKHQKNIDEIASNHQKDMDEIRSEFLDEKSELAQNYENELSAASQRLDEAHEVARAEKAEYEQRIVEIENEISLKEEDLANKENQFKKDYADLKSTNQFLSAEYHALRQKLGLMTEADDYTSKERFEELELEFEAFNQFFKEQWKRTKRSIRKQLLWTKEEKKNLKK